MSTPKVSVLMPAYNRANYIGQAIQSVLDQTYSDLELIVVDDGSTDNTAEVVQRFTDPRVCYIYQQNKGVSGALNTAFQASHGCYIALLGSDDALFPDMLMETLPLLEANPDVGLVYARAQAMDSEGRLLPQVLGAPEKYPGQTFKSLLYGDCVCGITAVFRRECAERAGLWDESIVANEDWDMWLRMSLVCRFHFVDKILAHFRIHPGGITSGHSEKFARLSLDRVRVLDKIYACSDLPPEARAVKALAYRNVYMDVGLRWLSVRAWRESALYFWKAIRVSPNPLVTPFRILYLILFYNVLSKTKWGSRLVSRLVDLRRRWRAVPVL